MFKTQHPFQNINWVFVAILAIATVLALWTIRSILMLMVAAIILTIFATMPVRFLVRRGFGRGLAILLSMLLGMVAIIVLFMAVFPTLFVQFTVLATDLIPRGVQQVIDLWNSGTVFEQFPFLETMLQDVEITDDTLNELLTQATTALGRLGATALPLLSNVVTGVFSTLVILFLCIYLIAEPERYIRGLLAITPLFYRRRMREILTRIDLAIRSWIKITALSMAIVGVLTAVGLALLGIQQWAALGVLAGLLSFIPNFGPILALIPSVAVAIIQAPENVLIVVLVIYAVSFIQSQMVAPLLANETMNLPPVLVLIGQIVFGVFFGFIGIMLAVPLTAMFMVLVQEIYVKDILGDHQERLPVRTAALAASTASADDYDPVIYGDDDLRPAME